MGQFHLPPSDVTIQLRDVTTHDADTTRHGFLKKLSGVAAQVLNGEGNWVVAAGGWG